MTKKTVAAFLCAMAILLGVVTIHAGGALETIDITGRVPSPIPGRLLGRVIGIKWDTRAIPVQYSVNNTLDPIPNPLGPAFLSVAAATAELQVAFDAWNNIPTSFIEMRITGTTNNLGLRGFDFVNELTFRTSPGFAAITSSPSVSLIEDTVLVDGDLIDNDWDPDVSDDITVVTDVDGDGDLEFPAGFYKAGTILDNDVQFNTKASSGFRFTIDPAAADTNPRSTDLAAIAVHEFGHSHGLSHSLNNQNGIRDGDGATMFPSIDTGDPVSELAYRTLEIDDISYSSFFYREGAANTGPAALQPGDIAFSKVFGLIRGALRHGFLAQPVAGGNVFTVNLRNNTAATSAFSGTTQLSFNPATGGLFFIADPAIAILDGNYVIPVPKGRYRVGIEPVDGQPVSATSVSFTTLIGNFFGQQNFNEEFLAGSDEDDDADSDSGDDDSDSDKGISVEAGETRRNINIVTSRDINIDNFGTRNFIGFAGSPAGRIYAVRIPAFQINDISQGGKILIKAAAFDTAVVDASVLPIFAEATLTTGVANADGSSISIDLANPLVRMVEFIGQDDDLAPFFFKNAHTLGRRVQRGIDRGQIHNLFLVLRLPTTLPFPGVSALPPLIGLDGGVPVNDVPIFGLSYTSDDGGATFTRRNDFNFRFSLRLAEAPQDDNGDDRE